MSICSMHSTHWPSATLICLKKRKVFWWQYSFANNVSCYPAVDISPPNFPLNISIIHSSNYSTTISTLLLTPASTPWDGPSSGLLPRGMSAWYHWSSPGWARLKTGYQEDSTLDIRGWLSSWDLHSGRDRSSHTTCWCLYWSPLC